MERKAEGTIVVILILLLAVAGYFVIGTYDIDFIKKSENNKQETEFTPEVQEPLFIDTVRVANWNLQIFGPTKASNNELLNFYADKIDDYDIFFVQEIRDSTGVAFANLCSKLPDYQCKISSRAGRSTSKEQYGILYKNGIELVEFVDYNPDEQDRWERPPIKARFKINYLVNGTPGDYYFSFYNIHMKPDDVKNEMIHLESVVSRSGESIILGDLNADCSYYNPQLKEEFIDWNWVIDDSYDTTVSQTDCAYDRILTFDESIVANYGVDKSLSEEHSDHYIVWVEVGK